MNSISILEKTKEYVVLKVPRRFMDQVRFSQSGLTEEEALGILQAGMAEYRERKTKTLISLRALSHGN
jgi:hypothetical protein